MRDARKRLFLRLWPNQLQQRCEEEVRVHGRCKEVSVFKAVCLTSCSRDEKKDVRVRDPGKCQF